MWQLVLSKVPVKRRVIYSDEHDLLCGLEDILGLPVHDGETVQLDGITCGVGMVIEGETLRSSLYLSPKVLPVLPMYSTVYPGW